MTGLIIYLIRFIMLASFYFIAGKIATLLAIPPGFATPVWPAAGIALACVLNCGYGMLPAVFIGSVATNILIVANQNFDQITLDSFIVGGGIGMGAMIQAGVGAYLVKRFITFPCRFELWRNIIPLLILGGLLSSCVNAIVGPLVLLTNGIIPLESLAISSFTWWAGDAIGTLLMAPALLLALNKEVALKRKIVVIFPTIIFTLLCISVFVNTERGLRQKEQLRFDNKVSDITNQFRQSLDTYEALLTANASFIQSSEYVSSEEFATFTNNFLLKYPSILSMSWNKRVTDIERAAYVKEIRDQGYPDYEIKDRLAHGTLEKAMPRGIYYPVTYITPYERNKNAHGYDTYGPDPVTHNARTRILDEARENKRAMATGRLSIVQAEDQYGLILYYPVFATEKQKITQPADELLGYCAGVFLIPEIVLRINKFLDESNVDLILSDVTEQHNEVLLYDSRTPDYKEPATPIHVRPELLQSSHNFTTLGRVWKLSYIQKSSSATLSHGWGLWAILLGGLFFTSMLCAFLLVFSSQLYGGAVLKANKEDDVTGKLFLPLLASSLSMLLAVFLWQTLKNAEKETIQKLAAEEQNIIEHRITSQIEHSIMALKHMGKRWEIMHGTGNQHWIADAHSMLSDLKGLTTIEYVDNSYHVKWVEPFEGNEKAVGLNIIFDKKRERILSTAAKKNHITLTPPLNLVQGYRGIIVYVPVFVDEKFDGFMVGIFNIKKLFESIAQGLNPNFDIIIKDQSEIVYSNLKDEDIGENLLLFGGKRIELYDRTWQMKVQPTPKLLTSQESMLPETVLLGGILLSVLLALTINNAQTAEMRSELLRAKTLALKKSENNLLEVQRFQNLIRESNPDLIFVKDRQFRIIDANSAFLSVYPEHERNSVIGTTTVEKFNPAEAAAFLKNDKEAFDVGYHANNETVHMPDGSVRTLHTKKVRFENKKGEQFILCIARDISERETLIERLNESNAELERFAYVASHDMQEPLRMIINFGAIIAEEYEDKLDDEGKEYLSMITKAGSRMKDMISDLLEYSRVEHTQTVEKTFNGEEILKGALDNLTNAIEQSSAQITHDTIPELYGNPMQFMRLLQNLIANALKYQPEGNTPKIHISVSDENTHYQVAVRDNGVGISKEYAEQVFQPFKRLHSWEQVQGTGLGLAICKKIVQNHGGVIWVEPNEDTGCTFYFTLKKET